MIRVHRASDIADHRMQLRITVAACWRSVLKLLLIDAVYSIA
jgi:hypothetical protein